MGLPIGKVAPNLLASIVYQHLGTRRADVLVHSQMGEDCTVIDFGDEVAVLTTDPITGAGPDLGWYAAFIATNDLAATGAEPVALLLTLLLAPGDAASDLARVMQDASAAARQLGVEIAGGHSEVTPGIERTIVVVTAVGRARKDQVLRSGGGIPGDALLLTKGAGIEGTAILAGILEHRLVPPLGIALVERAKAFRGRISVLPEARAAARGGAHAMHDVTEGGVLGAAYEMAEAGGIGVHIDAARVPVLPETAAICAQLGADPLRLVGSGGLLVATPDPARTVMAISDAGVRAVEIGRFLPRDRVVRRRDVDLALEPPAGDELWRVLRADAGDASSPGSSGS
ncbi:MAG TPA: AIR synthase-related protein [bacterium]|nr:AIR synthase-related protein [bacterium]